MLVNKMLAHSQTSSSILILLDMKGQVSEPANQDNPLKTRIIIFLWIWDYVQELCVLECCHKVEKHTRLAKVYHVQ